MTILQIIDRACLTAAAGFVLFVCGYIIDRIAAALVCGGLLFIDDYIITGNFSGQSYSSGTYFSGCAPKWSK